MFSGLVTTSPTLDLGGRSHNATSRSAPTITISPVTATAISIEYASLRHDMHCPTGMYVTPSAESMLVWDGVLFVHKGDYAGSILKFIVTFPNDYPERPPAVRFVTDVFHPLVAAQTGVLSMTPRFRPWRPREHHIHDVLYFVKAAFKQSVLDKMNEVDVANREAFKYTENRSSFAALAQQSSQLSQSSSTLYDTPSSRKAYSFRFTPTDHEQVSRALETLSIRTPSRHCGRVSS